MTRNHLYLFLITLFGAITRLWFFWTDGLHVDEKFTLDLVQHDLWYVIHYSLTTDCNPPLFYIFDWISVHLLGVNAFAERFPSIIAGILLIPAVYYLGKEWRGETLGLLSALAVSTLGSMWYYSQFGRAYMLECLLFVMFCIFWLRLAQRRGTTCDWWAVSIVAAVLAFTHLFSIIPVGILLIYLVCVNGVNNLKWIALTGVLSSPLLFLFNAILTVRAVPRDIAAQSWNWYGATVPQLIVFAPLEYFGYVFVFWIPLVLYSAWLYRKEVLVLLSAWITSFLSMLALANTTPVFIRYTLLFVPVLVTIGLIPVSEFLDSDSTWAQKAFVIGSFGVMYFAIIVFSFWSGLYMPKGNITI